MHGGVVDTPIEVWSEDGEWLLEYCDSVPDWFNLLKAARQMRVSPPDKVLEMSYYWINRALMMDRIEADVEHYRRKQEFS